MMAEGTSSAVAWTAVASARGLPVPDTDEQRTWLEVVMAAP
jgi:hypothetical protein